MTMLRSMLPTFLTLAALLSPRAGQLARAECADPLAAVLATLECVEKEDPVCASQGYNASVFKKMHNGVDTNTVIDSDGLFWSQAFTFVDLSLDYDHMENIGPNQASVRYVETVRVTSGVELGLMPPCNEHPFGQTITQYEHALVTVDNDCKITLWDQYGDNQEQSAVDDAVSDVLKHPAVQCRIGILPPEECTDVTFTCGPPEESASTRMASTWMSNLFLLIASVAGVARHF